MPPPAPKIRIERPGPPSGGDGPDGSSSGGGGGAARSAPDGGGDFFSSIAHDRRRGASGDRSRREPLERRRDRREHRRSIVGGGRVDHEIDRRLLLARRDRDEADGRLRTLGRGLDEEDERRVGLRCRIAPLLDEDALERRVADRRGRGPLARCGERFDRPCRRRASRVREACRRAPRRSSSQPACRSRSRGSPREQTDRSPLWRAEAWPRRSQRTKRGRRQAPPALGEAPSPIGVEPPKRRTRSETYQTRDRSDKDRRRPKSFDAKSILAIRPDPRSRRAVALQRREPPERVGLGARRTRC